MRRMRVGAVLAAAIGVAAFQNVGAEGRATEIFNGLCNRCHGHQGQGMPGLEAPLIAGMPAWFVEAQINKFREGKRGTNARDLPGMRMRPMARSIYTEEDIKAISAYVEAMPRPQAPITLTGADPAKGKIAFGMCVGCHGADGNGNQAMGAAPLAGQSDWYIFTQLKNFKSGVRGTAPGDAQGAMMRSMTMGLDENTMKNIAAYVGSLPGK